MTEFIPIAAVDISESDIAEVVATLRSGWLTTGPRVATFEERSKALLGCTGAVAVNSGTAALHLALSALEIGPGDEVITTPLTFAATINAILYVGATPVLADVDPDTLQISASEIAQKIGPKTRAVLVVHYGGAAADLDAIEAALRPRTIPVVEDAALALGAVYRGRRVGQTSRAACFSFHPVKNITTGEGGLLATSDRALEEVARLRSWHGIDKSALSRYQQKGSWHYEVQDLGFKYNMSDLQAGLGLHQLGRIEHINCRRRQIAADYDTAFRARPGVTFAPDPEQGAVRLPYWMVLDPAIYDRDRFMTGLTERNIGSAVHYIPVNHHPYYRRRLGWEAGMCPRAEYAYKGLISLPLYGKMTPTQQDRVKEAVLLALDEAAR